MISGFWLPFGTPGLKSVSITGFARLSMSFFVWRGRKNSTSTVKSQDPYSPNFSAWSMARAAHVMMCRRHCSLRSLVALPETGR